MLVMRKLNSIIRTMRIRSNDTILLKAGSDLAKQEVIEEMSHLIEKAGYRNVIIIVIDDFDNIERIKEEDMNKYGWFRATHIARKREAIVEKQQEEINAEQV